MITTTVVMMMMMMMMMMMEYCIYILKIYQSVILNNNVDDNDDDGDDDDDHDVWNITWCRDFIGYWEFFLTQYNIHYYADQNIFWHLKWRETWDPLG